jgi:hypothetical protein
LAIVAGLEGEETSGKGEKPQAKATGPDCWAGLRERSGGRVR